MTGTKRLKGRERGRKVIPLCIFLLPHPPLLTAKTLPKGWHQKIFSYTVLENSMLAVLKRPAWKV